MTIASTQTSPSTGSGSTSRSPSWGRPDRDSSPFRRPPISVAVLDLLERARCTLEDACRTADASERYRDAHLGALRAAAAIVAARTTPSARSRPRSVWQVLPGVAPELAEWAAFFAACSTHRSVIDRGGRIPAREADDLLRQAEMFLEIAQDLLGVPLTIPLPELTTPLLVSTSAAQTQVPLGGASSGWAAPSSTPAPGDRLD
ncbi:hypothetical protein Intca_1956 [Intrasporangium calvum DSM 43043]|uniref:SAV-6107-like HEPN domain-containing protein n=1 Tax=Intrasporangium calvum (strain ATCC 23552 / DSM 43043 / JCM 3097 / NBRC 12989 / NCIMB 10167 / NRRL B-3866 / 7 KIP) TaxID=710696 RepID=E6SBV8_INTC7|nr:hypothetical protein Intca_1956 [Intrasporangium calvum DSM 43043]